MSEEILAGGHELWVPVALDMEPDELERQLLDRFGDDDATADSAAFLVGTARQLAQANATAEDAMILNLAAWGLLTKPDVLHIRGVATLRAAGGLAPGTTADQIIERLAGGSVLFDAPVKYPIDTHSGEAVSVRVRPMVDEDGVSRVVELAAVLWARPDVSAWYMLSTYTEDLVEAKEIGELLEELGAGMEGL